MASNYARELAAICWTQDSTRHKVMDVELAEEFAIVLDQFMEIRARMHEEIQDLKAALSKIESAVNSAVSEVNR